MSKGFGGLAVLAGMLIFVAGSAAQHIESTIRIAAGGTAVVEGRGRGGKSFGFLSSVAGASGLAKRISDISLTAGERGVPFRQLGEGEYLAEAEFDRWRYQINLTPLPNRAAAAHASWVAGGQGVLMLDDLLPKFGPEKSVRVRFELPAGWRILTPEEPVGGGFFEIENLERAVFLVGNGWRSQTVTREPKFDLHLSGEWHFTDDEAAMMAAEIIGEYRKIFGGLPARAQVAIAKFPVGAPHGAWEAETRGSSVLILSGDTAFRTQSLQRLHEQLRHEIFHLWLPNGVNLSGNYDWFYEGFALYQSLKTALALNRIRFEDFLDTLSRAYTIDAAISRRQPLIESSRSRWSGGDLVVYARGLLTAFAADAAMLHEFGGKRSVSDLVAEVYRRHGGQTARQDGNQAVLAIMGRYSPLAPIIDQYVKGTAEINPEYFTKVGIAVNREGGPPRLKVVDKPSGRQKALLNKLGYNNWRKLSSGSK